MIADMWVGNTEWSEVFLVIAFVAFMAATVVHFSKHPPTNTYWFPLLTFGLASLALAFLVL
jgi:hypothetical protein